MTDYLNPHRVYPDCPSRRIDNPPGNDSIRPEKWAENETKSAEVQTSKGQQGKTINGVFVKQNDIKECGE